MPQPIATGFMARSLLAAALTFFAAGGQAAHHPLSPLLPRGELAGLEPRRTKDLPPPGWAPGRGSVALAGNAGHPSQPVRPQQALHQGVLDLREHLAEALGGRRFLLQGLQVAPGFLTRRRQCPTGRILRQHQN